MHSSLMLASERRAKADSILCATFVSELANADVPADVRRQISGHSDEKIHELYTHLDVEPS